MKEFTTITELEILRAACDAYLMKWTEAKEKLDQNPDNLLYKHRYETAKATYEELNAAILKLENA